MVEGWGKKRWCRWRWVWRWWWWWRWTWWLVVEVGYPVENIDARQLAPACQAFGNPPLLSGVDPAA